MSKNKPLLILAILSSAVFLNSCLPSVKDFSDDQLKWFKPYTKTDSIIFVSEKNERDTIVFFKKILKKDTVRNFIELGYYTTNYLSVHYTFTSGSYHQSALMSDNVKRYDQNLFNLSKTSNNINQFEVTFIGIIFNGEELNNIKKRAESIYYFDAKKATYSGINVEKSINNFTFDTRVGITKFIDERNVSWERIKR